MASSFSILGSNLFTTGFEKFREMMKMLDLVTRKGVYLYEYTDNWEKLNETTLPDKAGFYRKLTVNHIDNKESDNVLKVWNHYITTISVNTHCALFKNRRDASDEYIREFL